MSLYDMQTALDIFRAVADPTRIRIIALLRAMDLSVGELAQVLGQSQPRVSRHVKILADAGLTDRRKEGSWVFLSLGDEARTTPLLAALDQWSALEEQDESSDQDIARLAAVRIERTAAAEAYFEAHASQWDAIRSFHVPDSEVESAILAILQERPLGRFVDLGTGTGRMIELLADHTTTITGLDRSPEMLRFARAKLANLAGPTVDLRQGDIHALPLESGVADTVLLHQVLHYIHQPAGAIQEAARLLAPNGRLLLVDFAAHDHEELRSEHAHARLGFADEQISHWLEASGLKLHETHALKGTKLTVKFWLAHKDSSARIAAKEKAA